MIRGAATRRSLVTVSAIPDDSQASPASPLTFSKSRTAIDGSAGTSALGGGAVGAAIERHRFDRAR